MNRSLWKHVVSGEVYIIEGIVLDEADLTPMVLYHRVGEEIPHHWVRPAGEFFDGRFVPHFSGGPRAFFKGEEVPGS